MNLLSAIGAGAIIILIVMYIKGNIGEMKCEERGYNGYQYSMGCYTRNGDNVEYEEWIKR